MQQNGYWEIRRREQISSWFHDMIRQRLIDEFLNEQNNKRQITKLDEQIQSGKLSVSKAMDLLFKRSEEHTSELQSRGHLVCRLLLEKKKYHLINELVTGSVTIIDNLEQYNNVFTILAINNHIDRRAVGDEKIF